MIDHRSLLSDIQANFNFKAQNKMYMSTVDYQLLANGT